jgi:hypothetical protein
MRLVLPPPLVQNDSLYAVRKTPAVRARHSTGTPRPPVGDDGVIVQQVRRANGRQRDRGTAGVSGPGADARSGEAPRDHAVLRLVGRPLRQPAGQGGAHRCRCAARLRPRAARARSATAPHSRLTPNQQSYRDTASRAGDPHHISAVAASPCGPVSEQRESRTDRSSDPSSRCTPGSSPDARRARDRGSARSDRAPCRFRPTRPTR